MNFLDYLDYDELPNPDYDLMLLWDSDEDDLDFPLPTGKIDA